MVRSCLKCGREFKTRSRFYRLCRVCREENSRIHLRVSIRINFKSSLDDKFLPDDEANIPCDDGYTDTGNLPIKEDSHWLV